MGFAHPPFSSRSNSPSATLPPVDVSIPDKAIRKRVSRGQILGFLLWSLLGFLLMGALAYRPLLEMAEGMLRVGWAQYFGWKVAGGKEFLLYCLNRQECAQVLLRAFPGGEMGLYGGLSLWFLLGGVLFLRPKRVAVSLRYGQHFATKEEVAPLVERRSPEAIVDSGLPGAPEPKEGKLMGYLGVWMGESLEAAKAFREKKGKPKDRLFLRLPPRVERIHTITYAGTGGGKTVGIFRPRIALDAAEGNIAIIFDTKYPNPGDSYLDVRDWFRAFGRKVRIIDPFGMETGEEAVQLPVLKEVRDFPSALDAARLIYPPDIENADAASRVFVANARSLLAGILYALSTSSTERLSFQEAAKVANLDTASLQNWFRRYPEAMAAIQSTLAADKYVLSGAQNRLVTDLEIFVLDSADRLFQDGPRAVSVRELLREPGMIHLVFPERYIRGSAGRAILRFFKRFFDQAILRYAEELGRPLDIHVNYYYDELALFGFLPDLDSDLATLRSRNISVHMATQSRAQMEAIYGERWEATENNNVGTFYLVPGSYTPQEATYWSKMLGRYSFVGVSLGESQGGDRRTESLSLAERERELITPDEMMTMGVGEMIVLVRGFHPILVRSYPVESPESPVNWIYRQAEEYRTRQVRSRLASIFGEPERIRKHLYAQKPQDLYEVYGAFEEMLLELGRRGGKLLYVPMGNSGYYILPRPDLEAMGVHPEALQAMVRYRFLAPTPQGLAIPPRCVYGPNRLQRLFGVAGILVESQS